MVELGEPLSIESNLIETDWDPVGEHPGDLTDPFAKGTNRKLIGYGPNPNIVIPIPEFGDVPAKDFRVWRSQKPGELIAFIRLEPEEQKTEGHKKVIVSTVLALGAVATALAAIKYSKRK